MSFSSRVKSVFMLVWPIIFNYVIYLYFILQHVGNYTISRQHIAGQKTGQALYFILLLYYNAITSIVDLTVIMSYCIRKKCYSERSYCGFQEKNKTQI